MAGIYIAGLEMPTKKEGVAVIIYPDGTTVVEPFDIGFSQYCEAIPVPDHGDLIDRDALGIRDSEKQAYEAYSREKGEDFLDEPLLEYLRGRSDGTTHVSGLVRFAPAIIPADKEAEA